MTPVRVSPAWLALREPADGAARAGELVGELRAALPADRPLVVHDLACGTGSMLRWLAPRLPGPQHWVLYDLDADLLDIAAAERRPPARDGSAVTVEVRARDVTRLSRDEYDRATLFTTSALLDLVTGEQLDRLVAMCVAIGRPAFFTLSVCGHVELLPAHRLDVAVGAAFNAHQRRELGGRRLLGPDAVAAVTQAFRKAGYEVHTAASPWRLGASERELTVEWFRGWLAAAREFRPELASLTRDYAQQRLADAAAGRLRVVVHHRDVLARPPRDRRRVRPC
jgi:trans-aconitate methyltransferase